MAKARRRISMELSEQVAVRSGGSQLCVGLELCDLLGWGQIGRHILR